MQIHPVRLKPDTDLRKALEDFTDHTQCSAGFVVSAVGSLKRACLRMAGASQTITVEGPFEIFALNGTLCQDGVHIHIGLSDKNGTCIGGHLCHGSIVYTTAEIVIGTSSKHIFTRTHDVATGYPELVIEAHQAIQAKGQASKPKTTVGNDPLE